MKKETVKKETVKKETVKTKKIPVTLISFSMKATVPVENYGNVSPEITVSAGSIKEAEEVVYTYIKDLYQRIQKDFKKQDLPKADKAIVGESVTKVEVSEEEVVEDLESKEVYKAKQLGNGDQSNEREHSPAFIAAYNMLNSSKGTAHEVIKTRIQNSTKLSEKEKKELLL